jgi:hypothetical protein
MTRSRSIFAIALLCATQFAPITTAHADSVATDAEQELADRYSPVVMVQTQPTPCSTDGEAFEPMSVDAVLGNGQMALRQVGAGDPVVKWGPQASDLFGLGEGFYLDFPGRAIEPECVYEQDFQRYTADLPPTVYARVVAQEDHPDEIVLQYWFYWYYNDWNNKHESDWEGIQLVFPAASAAQALSVDPTSIGYAQHEAGERQSWTSDVLDRDGDHPVVYPSTGSHASYFDSALHIGRSAGEGFGCDDSTGPSDELRPAVVLLPDGAPAASDAFAWLAFEGRWGERHGGPYNGPTGPTTKDRWTRPIDWQDTLRTSSVVVPAVGTRSGAVADTFCNVVESGSNLLLRFAQSPLTILIALVLVFLLVRFLARRTVWTRTPTSPITARRRSGEILRTSVRMLSQAKGTFTMIGVAAIPVAIAGAVLAALVQRLQIVSDFFDLTGTTGLSALIGALLVTAVASALAFTFVGAAVARTMADMDDGRPPSWRRSVGSALAKWRPLLAGFGLAAALVIVLGCTIVLAPIALFMLVRRVFLPQAVMLDDIGSARGAIARSIAATRRRWLHTAVTIGAMVAATKLVSTTIGLIVLIVAKPPFWLLSLMIVAVDAVLAPISAITATYLYGNATALSAGTEDTEDYRRTMTMSEP